MQGILYPGVLPVVTYASDKVMVLPSEYAPTQSSNGFGLQGILCVECGCIIGEST